MNRRADEVSGYGSEMRSPAVARFFFGFTALCVLAGLVIQIPLTARTDGFFDTPLARVLNLFCFFTILSNIIVGATTLQLSLHPDTDSTVFRIVRLAGVVQIFVTGVVYWIALSDLVEYGKWESVANQLVHTIVPVLGVVGWVAFGPRGKLTPRVVVLSTLVPIAWLAFTLIRGPLARDWYPYPFLDVGQHGYVRVLINAVIVAALYLGIAFGALAFDRRVAGEPEPAV